MRSFPKAAFLLFAAIFSALCTSQAAKRPNIVIIFTDDHAQHAISAYGSTINKTPHIDQLAAEGVRFNQSFVGNAICGPSRATLLTGLHSHANGQTGNRSPFRDELPSFAKTLQANGYDTAMIGKWHITSKPNGFDHWAIKRGGYYNSRFETKDGIKKSEGHVTDVITQQSLDWIKDRPEQENPFMVWISHSAVHRVWAPALRHLDRYADQHFPEPENLFDTYTGKAPGAATAQMTIARDLFPAYDLMLPVTGKGILDNAAKGMLNTFTPEQRRVWDAAFVPRNEAFAKMNLEGDALTRWNYQRYIKNYLRCVDGLDESVGTVRSFLKENNLDQDTIVIYTSDQGFFLGDHGWYDKRWMYEESFRTPLIIHWPGITEGGTTTEALVQNIDLAPTFLEMAEIDTHASMHGNSLVPILKGSEPADWRDSLYYHYQMIEPTSRTSHLVARHYGVRTQHHKLIYFYDFDQWELYDLISDPKEILNQYENPHYQGIVGDLKKNLKRLRSQYADQSGKDF